LGLRLRRGRRWRSRVQRREAIALGARKVGVEPAAILSQKRLVGRLGPHLARDREVRTLGGARIGRRSRLSCWSGRWLRSALRYPGQIDVATNDLVVVSGELVVSDLPCHFDHEGACLRRHRLEVEAGRLELFNESAREYRIGVTVVGTKAIQRGLPETC
jgi:hypothetical protein